jgi:hypothetical protein
VQTIVQGYFSKKCRKDEASCVSFITKPQPACKTSIFDMMKAEYERLAFKP